MKNSKISKLLCKYILIDTVVIILPLLAFLFFFINNEREGITQRYINNEKLLLYQNMFEIEATMDDLANAATQIGLDKEMKPYRWKNNNYDTIAAMNKLNYYRAGQRNFTDLVICLDGVQKVYGADGIESFDVFSNWKYRLGSKLDKERLMELMKGKQSFAFLNSTECLQGGSCNFAVVTYPIGPTSQEKYGTLSGVLDRKYFETVLLKSSMESRTVICNLSGGILYSTDDFWSVMPEEGMELLKAYTQGKFKYTFESDGKAYEAVVCRGQTTGWIYMQLIESRTLAALRLKEQMPAIIIIIVLGTLLVLFVGVALAFYNYLPIRSLCRLFDGRSDYREKKDELLLLNKYICDLQEDNSTMEQKLRKKELFQTRELIIDILYGGYPFSEEENEILNQQGINEGKNEFAVISLMWQQEESNYDCSMFKNRLPYIETEYLFFIAQEPENCFTMLYCAPRGMGMAGARAEELCRELAEDGFRVRAGVGGNTTDLKNLKESLVESLFALDRVPEKEVAVFAELDFVYSAKDFIHPQKEELMLQLAIRRGEKKEILELLNAFETKLSEYKQYCQKHEIRYILYRIMNYLHELPGISEARTEYYMENMLAYKDVSDFFHLYGECVELTLNEETSRICEIKGHRIQEIQAFIDENYNRPDMSLTLVADYYGIRESHFSKFFKENAGVNFIVYLSQKRLEEGRRMLCKTDFTLQKIVESIGYSDVSAFSRKFVHNYGMSPGAYRKKMGRLLTE